MMTKRKKRVVCSTHCFFWRWHHVLAGFFAFVAVGVGIGFAAFSAPKTESAHASASENVMGWAWADPIGWISMNDTNPGSGGGSYGVNVDLANGELTGFGWSPTVGWVCFGSSCTVGACIGMIPPSHAPYDGMFARVTPPPSMAGGPIREVHGWAKICSLDDEGWMSLNCADPNPSLCGTYPYHVAFNMSTDAFSDPTPPGSPANGSSFAWNGNVGDTGIGYVDFQSAYLVPPTEADDVTCADGIDNDLDGAIDCADPGCVNTTPCKPPPPALTEDQCPLGTADLCCSDTVDNNSNGLTDCADLDCQAKAPICAVAWIKTQYGNVYAQQGIEAIAAPAAQFNATYCLSTGNGTIAGFASQSGCVQTGPAYSVPKSSMNYRGSLGAVDVAGILAGRYGPVVPIASGDAIPENLNGRVYVFQGPGTLMLPSKHFRNAAGSGERGNGLLFAKGADVIISDNVEYDVTAVATSLRALASFGVIALTANGSGGTITIAPNVTRVAGALFAEDTIRTGNSTDPLTVYGLMAARRFVFERMAGTSSTPSESVIFDGRALVNPPPGMQDVGKSLPRSKDAY